MDKRVDPIVLEMIQEYENQMKNQQESMIKGCWSVEEDGMILEHVRKKGARDWSLLSKNIKGRIGKQYPRINKDKWTHWEDSLIIKAHKVYGNKWTMISKLLQGRTDNSIKNHWNSSLKKKYKTTEYSPQAVNKHLDFLSTDHSNIKETRPGVKVEVEVEPGQQQYQNQQQLFIVFPNMTDRIDQQSQNNYFNSLIKIYEVIGIQPSNAVTIN